MRPFSLLLAACLAASVVLLADPGQGHAVSARDADAEDRFVFTAGAIAAAIAAFRGAHGALQKTFLGRLAESCLQGVGKGLTDRLKICEKIANNKALIKIGERGDTDFAGEAYKRCHDASHQDSSKTFENFCFEMVDKDDEEEVERLGEELKEEEGDEAFEDNFVDEDDDGGADVAGGGEILLSCKAIAANRDEV